MGGKRKAKPKTGRPGRRLRILDKDGPDFINNLNDDCLAKIFSYIPVQKRFTLHAVCKRWSSDLAWRDIKSLDFTYRSLPKLVKMGTKGLRIILKKCGRILHELNFGHGLNSTILPVIGDYCRNLRKLEIRLHQKDNRCLGWFIQMEKMQYFKIKANKKHFSQTFFESLCHGNFTELHLFISESLDVWPGCPCHLPFIAADVLERLTNLTQFTLSGFVLISNIVLIINRMANLTFLSLGSCTAKEGLPNMHRLKNLEHLDVSRIPQVSDDFIIEVSKNCKKLKVLKLWGCDTVSDIGIKTLETLSLLEELYLDCIYKITDAPLSKLHTLGTLSCENCHEVEDDGIIDLMKYDPNLKYLNLIHTGITPKVLTEANRMVVGIAIIVLLFCMSRALIDTGHLNETHNTIVTRLLELTTVMSSSYLFYLFIYPE